MPSIVVGATGFIVGMYTFFSAAMNEGSDVASHFFGAIAAILSGVRGMVGAMITFGHRQLKDHAQEALNRLEDALGIEFMRN